MKKLALGVWLLAASGVGLADDTARAQLKADITAADARLFQGLNDGKIGPLKDGFSTRLEFYHDQSGVTNYDQNIAIFEQTFRKPTHPRRVVLPETVEVFPAGPNHAMHIGQHRFCSSPSLDEPESCSIYRFSMVWERDGRQWKLLRVLSYDH